MISLEEALDSYAQNLRALPAETVPVLFHTRLPSRNGVGTVVMKNCEPLPLGPAFWYLGQK